MPQTLVSSFTVNGPTSTFTIDISGVIPSNASMVNLSVITIDGDSNNGTNQCTAFVGGCYPTQSLIGGYDSTGNFNQVYFLNQQKNGIGIWAGGSYSGSIPVNDKKLYINKAAGVSNSAGGGGMNAYIYVNGYL
jgi:hypothetical protein